MDWSLLLTPVKKNQNIGYFDLQSIFHSSYFRLFLYFKFENPILHTLSQADHFQNRRIFSLRVRMYVCVCVCMCVCVIDCVARIEWRFLADFVYDPEVCQKMSMFRGRAYQLSPWHAQEVDFEQGERYKQFHNKKSTQRMVLIAPFTRMVCNMHESYRSTQESFKSLYYQCHAYSPYQLESLGFNCNSSSRRYSISNHDPCNCCWDLQGENSMNWLMLLLLIWRTHRPKS